MYHVWADEVSLAWHHIRHEHCGPKGLFLPCTFLYSMYMLQYAGILLGTNLQTADWLNQAHFALESEHLQVQAAIFTLNKASVQVAGCALLCLEQMPTLVWSKTSERFRGCL